MLVPDGKGKDHAQSGTGHLRQPVDPAKARGVSTR